MAVRRALKVCAFGLAAVAAVVAPRSWAPSARVSAPTAPQVQVETTATLAPPSLVAPDVAVRVIERAAAETGGATPTQLADRLAAEILEAFASLSIERLDVALTHLLPALVREDAFAAARLAESVTEPNLRGEAMHLVARLWGEKNAGNALAWAGGLKIEYEREAALADAAAPLARENPGRATQLAARSLAANEPSPALENLAHQWAEKNFPAALEWTLANSAGMQREQLLARLAFVESSTNGHAAAQLVAEAMKPGAIQDEAIISVLHQWGPRDLSAALAWVDRFPENALRARAVAELDAIAKFRLATTAR